MTTVLLTGGLTPEEARVLYTALRNSWAPMVGYDEFQGAVAKLCRIGGGVTCRDCVKLGTRPSRYGGMYCDEHKAAEDERFAREEHAARSKESSK